MEVKNKKILVVGSSASAYALIKKLNCCPNVDKVYAAPGKAIFADIAELADIREDKPDLLLEFAVENGIDLTVVVSEIAIKNDIAGVFNGAGQMIFAPSKQSASAFVSRAASKKFLYKQRITTPKFAIFDKQQLAYDYIKTANMPLIIKCDENSEAVVDRFACVNVSEARTYIDDLFFRGEKKVILEDYVYGHDFTFYVITDGYNVLPIMCVADYKFASDGDGGIFTSGTGAFAPDYKISSELVAGLMKDVASRIVNSLEKSGAPYVGIMGFDAVLSEEGAYCITGLKTFFQDHDSALILELIDEDIVQLFIACAVGSFADDYDFIRLQNKSGVSCLVTSTGQDEKVIKGLDCSDCDSEISFINVKRNEYFEYITQKGKSFVITRTASTLSLARELMYENLSGINFAGMKYRKDICAPVK